MIKIELCNASNGIIKKINTNKFEESSENLKVYEFNEDFEVHYATIVTFLDDICADLGLEIGSDYEFAQLKFDVDWGDKYIPEVEEIDEKIKDLKSQLKKLKALRADILKNGDNV